MSKLPDDAQWIMDHEHGELPEKPPCRYCNEGHKLVGDEHWIVQSIIPASIKIVKCKSRRSSGVRK